MMTRRHTVPWFHDIGTSTSTGELCGEAVWDLLTVAEFVRADRGISAAAIGLRLGWSLDGVFVCLSVLVAVGLMDFFEALLRMRDPWSRLPS